MVRAAKTCTGQTRVTRLGQDWVDACPTTRCRIGMALIKKQDDVARPKRACTERRGSVQVELG